MFRSAATTLQAAEESLATTLAVLQNDLTQQGASANDVALELGVSLDVAMRVLDGTAVPDELAAWRASEVARLVQDVYQDLDSYRNGLLCCQVADPITLIISATRPSDAYRKRYESRAEALGLTVHWPHATVSLLEVKDHLTELDRQATAINVDPPAGRIDGQDVTVTTDSAALHDWIGDHLGQWIRPDRAAELSDKRP